MFSSDNRLSVCWNLCDTVTLGCLCWNLCDAVTNWWATNTLYYSLPDADRFVTDTVSMGGEASRSVDHLMALKTINITRNNKTNVATLGGELSVQSVIATLLQDGTWPADPDAVYGLISDSTIKQV